MISAARTGSGTYDIRLIGPFWRELIRQAGSAAVRFIYALLEELNKRPDGRATLDELSQEMATIHDQDISSRLSALSDIDVLQAGLVILESDGVRITDAGRSVLRALEALDGAHRDSRLFDRSQAKITNCDLIDPELRQSIYSLGLRSPGKDFPPEMAGEEHEEIEPEVSPEASSDLAYEVEIETAEVTEGDVHDPAHKAAETDIRSAVIPHVPTFLNRQFTSTSDVYTQPRFGDHVLLPSTVPSLKRFSSILRGHIEQEALRVKSDRQGGGIGGAVLAVLALLTIVIFFGAAIAVNQIKSLKSQITALERQLGPLEKQMVNSEQERRTRVEQNKLRPTHLAAAMTKSQDDNLAAPAALTLSPEEVQLIREYIKPAPAEGRPGQPINVGDPVDVSTIPLPSPLTEKIPKLVGGRFTIHSGAIVILRRDSRRADAVLPPS